MTEIEVETVDPVCTIRLDRPERLNALTNTMLRELRDAVDAAAANPAVVGIVITGNGRGFCSGLDAGVLTEATAAGSSIRPQLAEGALPGLFSYLLRVPKPVIAAVNGACAGGGFVLAALCDLRFASTEAFFTTVFSKRGLIAEHGTTWVLPRLIGTGRALDLLWSSRRVGASEAARMGLVECVTEPDAVVSAAQEYIRELAANVSPASLADTKRLVNAHWGTNYPEALAEIDEVQYAALDRPDAAEGAASFVERRVPNFPRLA